MTDATCHVTCLGEMLIDFVPDTSGVTLGEAERFIKAPGGAPANVAVGVAQLGRQAAFCGRVGDDPFGRWLTGILDSHGVDTAQVTFDQAARTALAFVTLTADGERDFMFYRHPSADMQHDPSDLDAAALQGTRVLHHGSISLIQEPSRAATFQAIDTVKQAGGKISYDPNLRLPLWPNETAAKDGIRSAWHLADVIKISDDELEFLTGSRDLAAATSLLDGGPDLLLVTLGAGGVAWFTPDGRGTVPGFGVTVKDTVGAGDAFVAGVLSGLAPLDAWPTGGPELEAILRRANAYAALATTRTGGIPAMATRAELDAFMQSNA